MSPPRSTCYGTSKNFRRLYPEIRVRVRRSLSSKIPNELLDGNLELGVISYEPSDKRLISSVIYTDALAFVIYPTRRVLSHAALAFLEVVRGK